MTLTELVGTSIKNPYRGLASSIVYFAVLSYMHPYETQEHIVASRFLFSDICSLLLDCLGVDAEVAMVEIENRRKEMYDLDPEDRPDWWRKHFRHAMPGQEEEDIDEEI
jgi:hypothetical protein